MLDLQFLCDHLDQVTENCRHRGVSVDLSGLLSLKTRRSELIVQIDNLRREQNDLSARIPKEKDAAQKQSLIARGKELRQEVS
ncbi:MAG: hypothetical protein ACKV0T_27120 [Planctomycetales bacterium]